MSTNSLQAFSSTHLKEVARTPGETTEDEFELEQQQAPSRGGTESPSPNDPAANVASVEDVPPDGGYGWVVTACVFLANCHTWGVNASWAVLLEHFLSRESFPGASKFEYAIIGGLSISQALIVGPLVVACQATFGTRYTMLFGGLVIFAALFSASASTQVWHLMLSQGLCFGYGMGFVYLPVRGTLLRSPTTSPSSSSPS